MSRPQSYMTGVLIRKRDKIRTQTGGQSVRRELEGSHVQVKERHQKKLNLLVPLSWTSSL